MHHPPPPPLDACFAAVAYTYPWANLIAHFKFHDNPGWARTLAALMRNTPFVEPALERADWVIPMPLSAQRLQERGYNQAWELACNLKPKNRRKTFKHKLDATLLLRVTDTLPQASLHRAERLTNLRTAFAVDPLRAKQLQDKHIVLVDDVMTSGASLYTAALALRAAGARHITGLVFARTDLHP